MESAISSGLYFDENGQVRTPIQCPRGVSDGSDRSETVFFQGHSCDIRKCETAIMCMETD